MADVTVIILTLNEELNIAHAVASVRGWAREVIVLDSGSTDRTVEIATAHGCRVVSHPFENYSRQRNVALSLPARAEWILFLDADERLTPEVKAEIDRRLADGPAENGFMLNRRFIWMGQWIRRGYFPSWILRLFRRGHGVCDDRGVNEQIVVAGAVGYIHSPFDHEDRKSLSAWIDRHNAYATMEAQRLIDDTGASVGRLFGSQADRKRWVRQRVWPWMPPLLRPFVYFTYRYLLRGGLLDGTAGFTYHFLHALWYPLLIDLKYLEMKRSARVPAEQPALAETTR